MSEFSTVGVDLAKGGFQVCGVKADGGVVFNKSVSRPRLHQLLAERPSCVVAMEACATSHHRGRVALFHGHEARLIPRHM